MIGDRKTGRAALATGVRRIFITVVSLIVYAGAMFFWLQYETNSLCDQLRDVKKTGTFTSRIPMKLCEFFLIRTAGERVSPRYEYALNLLGSMQSERGRGLMEEYLTSHLWHERYVAVSSLAYYQDERMLQSYLQQLQQETHPDVIQHIFVCLMKGRNRLTASYLDEVAAAVSGNEARYYLQRVRELVTPDSPPTKVSQSGFDEPALERIRLFDIIWNDEKGVSRQVPASGALQLETGKVR